MKSYIQGLITGGVFVFAFMVLMGSTTPLQKSTTLGQKSKTPAKRSTTVAQRVNSESGGLKVTEYKIVSAISPKVLTKLVNGYIQNGWKPIGSFVKMSSSVYQVIVKWLLLGSVWINK